MKAHTVSKRNGRNIINKRKNNINIMKIFVSAPNRS